jgi:hypothetical protein
MSDNGDGVLPRLRATGSEPTDWLAVFELMRIAARGRPSRRSARLLIFPACLAGGADPVDLPWRGWSHSDACRTVNGARACQLADHLMVELSARRDRRGPIQPQIGERLYISSRTAQTHLAHIFATLDMPDASARSCR